MLGCLRQVVEIIIENDPEVAAAGAAAGDEQILVQPFTAAVDVPGDQFLTRSVRDQNVYTAQPVDGEAMQA
ncbi:hypothetical protein [Pseudomonas sp. KNUC1026]|uniref:hypothetical protein n=1 Tax=Pseudomonas sp. KNUC1026 TaxID=2893890 RepID=UPI001F471C44|nr:hypothetical protein [Pseudomonas sp. KNUC1026]UFH48591.1 hypothetical protein LN139_16120 [Pseudomonas sp. KNUC1026]